MELIGSLIKRAEAFDQNRIIRVVLDSLESEHSRRAYSRALTEFFSWHEAAGRPVITKSVVQSYVAQLRDGGLAPSSINQRLAAIRKLIEEAADAGAIDLAVANSIRRVKGARQEGRRAGNWLTKRQAQQLLNSVDVGTLKGLRDRAILAMLLGCGLRRNEAAELGAEHIDQRDGRWVIVDLVGKRGKIRSIPMPSWAKAAVDVWTAAAGLERGRIFRSINKGGRITGAEMTPQAIRNVVADYAGRLGFNVAPHDLRRTFAKLAHKGGAQLEQIQLSLGHASIKTTEIYLGVEQDLTNAPCDHLGLRLD